MPTLATQQELDPVTGIVLAAGRSQRMGSPKALLDVSGEPALAVLIANIAGLGGAVVVVRSEFAGSAIEAIASRAGATILANDDPDRGMLSSIQLGLSGVPPWHDFLVWPVDHALVDAESARALIQARARLKEPTVFSPTFEGRAGHPILISAGLREQILAVPPTATLRDALAGSPRHFTAVSDPLVALNPNTPGEWQQALACFEARRGR